MAADITPTQMADELRSMVLNLDPKRHRTRPRITFLILYSAWLCETGFQEGLVHPCLF